jgi:hypothetical protein
MSLGHGASIVRDGLVFQYDMSNTAKSWKGKPTTNLILGGADRANAISSPINYYAFSSIAYTHEYNFFYSGDRPHVFKILSTNDTGYVGMMVQLNIDAVVGEVYSYSFDYRQIKGSSSALGGVIIYGDGYKLPDTTNYYSNLTTEDIDLEDGWKRRTHTYTATYAGQNFLRINLSTGGYLTDGGGDFEFYLDNFQIENSTFATPFVDGTRSNTEAIIDISRQNNTVTTSNLVYNTDGTFEFNGSSSTLNLGYVPELLPADITQEAWVRADSFTNWHGIISNMSSWGTGFSLQIGTEQNIAAMVSGSYLKTSWVPSINTWYHICATHRSSDDLNVLYVNGTQEASTTRAVSYEANAETKIGCFYTIPSLFLDGKISSIRTYSRALTPEEVKQNFEATRGRYGI